MRIKPEKAEHWPGKGTTSYKVQQTTFISSSSPRSLLCLLRLSLSLNLIPATVLEAAACARAHCLSRVLQRCCSSFNSHSTCEEAEAMRSIQTGSQLWASLSVESTSSSATSKVSHLKQHIDYCLSVFPLIQIYPLRCLLANSRRHVQTNEKSLSRRITRTKNFQECQSPYSPRLVHSPSGFEAHWRDLAWTESVALSQESFTFSDLLPSVAKWLRDFVVGLAAQIPQGITFLKPHHHQQKNANDSRKIQETYTNHISSLICTITQVYPGWRPKLKAWTWIQFLEESHVLDISEKNPWEKHTTNKLKQKPSVNILTLLITFIKNVCKAKRSALPNQKPLASWPTPPRLRRAGSWPLENAPPPAALLNVRPSPGSCSEPKENHRRLGSLHVTVYSMVFFMTFFSTKHQLHQTASKYQRNFLPH